MSHAASKPNWEQMLDLFQPMLVKRGNERASWYQHALKCKESPHLTECANNQICRNAIWKSWMKCHPETDHVIEIEKGPFDLQGILQFGEIPKTLIRITLRHQQITHFDVRQLKGSKLTVLDLSHNLIKDANLDLTGSKLQTLDLSHNQINNAHLNLVGSELDSLYLNNNQIPGISFDGLKGSKLRYLHLEHNQIIGVDLNLEGSQLLTLNLDHNQINGVDLNLEGSQLLTLILEHNRIVDVSFSGLARSKLQYLNLDHNQIINVDLNLKGTELQTLRLQHNRITHFPFEGTRESKLTRLNLMHNKLENVDKIPDGIDGSVKYWNGNPKQSIALTALNMLSKPLSAVARSFFSNPMKPKGSHDHHHRRDGAQDGDGNGINSDPVDPIQDVNNLHSKFELNFHTGHKQQVAKKRKQEIEPQITAAQAKEIIAQRDTGAVYSSAGTPKKENTEIVGVPKPAQPLANQANSLKTLPATSVWPRVKKALPFLAVAVPIAHQAHSHLRGRKQDQSMESEDETEFDDSDTQSTVKSVWIALTVAAILSGCGTLALVIVCALKRKRALWEESRRSNASKPQHAEMALIVGDESV